MNFEITIEQVNEADKTFSLIIDGERVVIAERATDLLWRLGNTIEHAMRDTYEI